MNKKIALFIGRFQPPHKGHEGIIKKIAKEVDYVIIGVGSANEHHTIDNPFTVKERIEMLDKTLKIKNYNIIPINDLHDYSKWAKHVKSLADFNIVYSGNQIVRELFEREGYEVKPIVHKHYISATAIRDMIHKEENWKKYVPKPVAKYIKKIKGIERIKDLYNVRFKNPIPTVDTIIEIDNQIVLIERRNKPYGWAIPGGHVDYGESVENAAVREAKEETSLDIKLTKLLGVYSDPKRDARGHRISTVFIAKAKGKPKANDDAKDVGLFTKDNLPKLAFDHKKILEDYFNEKGNH